MTSLPPFFHFFFGESPKCCDCPHSDFSPSPGASSSSLPQHWWGGCMELGSGVPQWRISSANHRHKTIWCGEMIDANTHFKHRQLNSCRQAPRLEFRAQLLGSDKVQNQPSIPRCYLIMKMWWLMLLSRGYNLPIWRFSAPKSSIPPGSPPSFLLLERRCVGEGRIKSVDRRVCLTEGSLWSQRIWKSPKVRNSILPNSAGTVSTTQKSMLDQLPWILWSRASFISSTPTYMVLKMPIKVSIQTIIPSVSCTLPFSSWKAPSRN